MKNNDKRKKGATHKGPYRIYISSAAGLSYTGVSANTEEEAAGLCDKYNSQDNSPYCKHVYL